MFGQPAYLLVVLEHGIAELGCPDEPAFSWVLNEWIFACAPAKWVVVQVLLLVPQFAFIAKPTRDRFVRILDPNTFEIRCFSGEATVGGNGTEQR